MQEPKRNIAEEYLDACDYISQDGHTVYIDTEAIVHVMQAYGDHMVMEYKRQQTDESEKDDES
tara:strand:+ start:644 stop:832 length:189 start_codon:yes stop_codon:yes gene_type:complete